MWPTPDPSAGTTAVYLVGYLGESLDWLRLAILVSVVGFAVTGFGLAVLAGLVMRR